MTPFWRQACHGTGGTMLRVLLLSGLCWCLHDYQFIDEPKTWHEAQDYCREKFSDLASIDNAKDMRRLIEALGSGYEGKVWIGYYDSRSDWRWTLSDQSFYGEGEDRFRKWSSGQPDAIRKRGKLCAFFHQGTWYDENCSLRFAFVCTNRVTNNTSDNTTQEYVFIPNKMKWWGAREYCRTNYADLACVRNDHENSKLHQVVGDGRTVWTGLYRNVWSSWSDHSRSRFENWVRGHPNNLSESCAVCVFDAGRTGEMVENFCKDRLPFMCHSKKNLIVMKLRALESTINLNDRTVTDTIINQLHDKIEKHQNSSDFRISWRRRLDVNVFHKEKKSAEGEDERCKH